MEQNKNETFEIEVKDGNRLGRRIGRVLGNVVRGATGGGGGGGGRIGSASELFDPNAFDGDGDGFVQDGTRWERPALAPGHLPKLPDAPSTPQDTTGDPTGGNNEQGSQSTPSQDDVQRTIDAIREIEPPAVAPIAAITRSDRSARASNTRRLQKREFFHTATPDEIADAVVPIDSRDFEEIRLASMVGSRSDYETQKDYEEAISSAKQFLAEVSQNRQSQIEVVKLLYNGKYGQSALEFDSIHQPVLYRERLTELFGSQSAFSIAISSPEFARIQHSWLTSVSSQQDTPPWMKRFVDSVLSRTEQAGQDRGKMTFVEAFYVPRIDAAGNTVYDKILVNPIEAIIANAIFATHGVRGRYDSSTLGTTVPTMRGHGPELIGAGVLSGPMQMDSLSANELAALLKSYFEFARLATVIVSGGFTDINGNKSEHGDTLALMRLMPEPEQIENRISAVQRSINSGLAGLGMLLPNVSKLGMNPMSALVSVPSFSEVDIAHVRSVVGRALRENPEFLAAVRLFGLPAVVKTHPMFSAVQNDTEIPPGVLDGTNRDSQLVNRIKNMVLKGFNQVRRQETQSVLTSQDNPGAFFGVYDRAMGWFEYERGGIFLQGDAQNAMTLVPELIRTETFMPSHNDPSRRAGETGTFMHETGHYVHNATVYTLESMALEMVRRAETSQVIQIQGNNTRERLETILTILEDANAVWGGSKKNRTDAEKLATPGKHSRTLTLKRLMQKYGNQTDLHPFKGRLPFDINKMTDEELLENFNSFLKVMQRITGPELLMNRRNQIDGDYERRMRLLRGMNLPTARKAQEKKKIREKRLEEMQQLAASANFKHNVEPYVQSAYGNTDFFERWAEGFISVLAEANQKHPTNVNNAFVEIIAELLGLKVEPSKTPRLMQKLTPDSPIATSTGINEVDRSDLITSTIEVVAPELSRLSDGHTLLPKDSTARSISQSMRFDRDERSMARSRSNMGLETDARLYAFDEPIVVQDYRSKQRLYKIGDHHFYDNKIATGRQMTRSVNNRLATFAANRYLNRDRPHYGDMVRTISSTQFGFFSDDMPTYETTTQYDLQMLRGLITGEIARLSPSQRGQIEEALKDTIYMSKAIQDSEPIKKAAYRILNVTPSDFYDGISVGDEIPLPLTAFSTGKRPDAPSTGVMLIILPNYKGIRGEIEKDIVITQGNFEVMEMRQFNDQLVVTLTHREVYDPLHDAMRPVDRFSDRPGAMRKMGSPLPRYTRAESERMEKDADNRGARSRSESSTPPPRRPRSFIGEMLSPEDAEMVRQRNLNEQIARRDGAFRAAIEQNPTRGQARYLQINNRLLSGNERINRTGETVRIYGVTDTGEYVYIKRKPIQRRSASASDSPPPMSDEPKSRFEFTLHLQFDGNDNAITEYTDASGKKRSGTVGVDDFNKSPWYEVTMTVKTGEIEVEGGYKVPLYTKFVRTIYMDHDDAEILSQINGGSRNDQITTRHGYRLRDEVRVSRQFSSVDMSGENEMTRGSIADWNAQVNAVRYGNISTGLENMTITRAGKSEQVDIGLNDQTRESFINAANRDMERAGTLETASQRHVRALEELIATSRVIVANPGGDPLEITVTGATGEYPGGVRITNEPRYRHLPNETPTPELDIAYDVRVRKESDTLDYYIMEWTPRLEGSLGRTHPVIYARGKVTYDDRGVMHFTKLETLENGKDDWDKTPWILMTANVAFDEDGMPTGEHFVRKIYANEDVLELRDGKGKVIERFTQQQAVDKWHEVTSWLKALDTPGLNRNAVSLAIRNSIHEYRVDIRNANYNDFQLTRQLPDGRTVTLEALREIQDEKLFAYDTEKVIEDALGAELEPLDEQSLGQVIFGWIKSKVEKRLAPIERMIKAKYGDDKPWKRGGVALRALQAMTNDEVNEVVGNFKNMLIRAHGRVESGDATLVKYVRRRSATGQVEVERIDVSQSKSKELIGDRDVEKALFPDDDDSYDLNSFILRHLLKHGELLIPGGQYESDKAGIETKSVWYAIEVPNFMYPDDDDERAVTSFMEVMYQAALSVERGYHQDGSLNNTQLPEYGTLSGLVDNEGPEDSFIKLPDARSVFLDANGNEIVIQAAEWRSRTNDDGSVPGFSNTGVKTRLPVTISNYNQIRWGVQLSIHNGRNNRGNAGDPEGDLNRSIYLDQDENGFKYYRISNGSMHVNEAIEGAGVATYLNQHPWLWFRQTRGSNATLSTASDGPLVWPLHGYQATRGGGSINWDKVKKTLILALLYSTPDDGHGSSARAKQQAERKAAEWSMSSRYGDSTWQQMLRTVDLTITGTASDKAIQLNQSTLLQRRRIAAFIRLLEQDINRSQISGGSQVPIRRWIMLANLTDARTFNEHQRNAWRNFFSNTYGGQQTIELDGSDDPGDFLPPFLINDGSSNPDGMELVGEERVEPPTQIDERLANPEPPAISNLQANSANASIVDGRVQEPTPSPDAASETFMQQTVVPESPYGSAFTDGQIEQEALAGQRAITNRQLDALHGVLGQLGVDGVASEVDEDGQFVESMQVSSQPTDGTSLAMLDTLDIALEETTQIQGSGNILITENQLLEQIYSDENDNIFGERVLTVATVSPDSTSSRATNILFVPIPQQRSPRHEQPSREQSARDFINNVDPVPSFLPVGYSESLLTIPEMQSGAPLEIVEDNKFGALVILNRNTRMTYRQDVNRLMNNLIGRLRVPTDQDEKIGESIHSFDSGISPQVEQFRERLASGDDVAEVAKDIIDGILSDFTLSVEVDGIRYFRTKSIGRVIQAALDRPTPPFDDMYARRLGRHRHNVSNMIRIVNTIVDLENARAITAQKIVAGNENTDELMKQNEKIQATLDGLAMLLLRPEDPRAQEILAVILGTDVLANDSQDGRFYSQIVIDGRRRIAYRDGISNRGDDVGPGLESPTGLGIGANSATILNRGAIRVLDTPVSLRDAARIVPNHSGMRRLHPWIRNAIGYGIDDRRVYRELTKQGINWRAPDENFEPFLTLNDINTPSGWWETEESIMPISNSPIQIDSNTARSLSYVRAVRQDFGVDLRRARSSSINRPLLRTGRQQWSDFERDKFNASLRDISKKYSQLQRQHDEILDSEEIDIDALSRIETQMIDLEDRLAGMVNTSNNVMAQLSEKKALLQALDEFLELYTAKGDSEQIPPENIMERIREFRNIVNREKTRGQLEQIEAEYRHAAVRRVLRNNFDLGYGVAHPGRFDGKDVDVDGAYLDEFDKDDIYHQSQDLLQVLTRVMFDSYYGKRVIDNEVHDEADKRIREFFGDITNKQRREWGSKNVDNRDPNGPTQEYLDDLDEATIGGETSRPHGVPTNTWRKIRAIVKLARSTKFDGERQTSYSTAIRLIQPYRPDLANEQWISRGARSSSGSRPDIVTTSGVNLEFKQMRGSGGSEPTVPFEKRTISRLIEKLRERGIELTPQEMATKKFADALQEALRGIDFRVNPETGLLPAFETYSKEVQDLESRLKLFEAAQRSGGGILGHEQSLANPQKVVLPTDALRNEFRNEPALTGPRRVGLTTGEVTEEMKRELELQIRATSGLIESYRNSTLKIAHVVQAIRELMYENGAGLIPVEGHTGKKVVGPVFDGIADVLGDDVDIAMLRTLGSPTVEHMADLAAEHYAEVMRLNIIFGGNADSNLSYRSELGGGNRSAFFETMRGRSQYYETDANGEPNPEVLWKDSNGAIILRVKKPNPEDEKKVTVAGAEIRLVNSFAFDTFVEDRPLEKLLSKFTYQDSSREGDGTALRTAERGYRSTPNVLTTNNVLFYAMGRAVGLESITSRDGRGYGGGHSLDPITRMEEQLEQAKRTLEKMEFAATPTGQHLRQMFKNKITRMEQQLDIIMRLGERYAHLMREMGFDDAQIRDIMKNAPGREVVLSFVDPQNRGQLNEGFIFYKGGLPTRGLERTPMVSALKAFVEHEVAGRFLPKIVDSDWERIGLHEIGHFVLGQGFTRHGEFTANIWPYLIHGDGFWSDFVEIQRVQADAFDKWSLHEGMGLVLTQDQVDAINGSPISSLAIESLGVGPGKTRYRPLTPEVRDRFRDMIFVRIDAMNNLNEEQKTQLKANIQELINNNLFLIRPKSRAKNDRRPVTPEMLDEGIPSIVISEPGKLESMGLEKNDLLWTGDTGVSIYELWNDLVPLPRRSFGWQRVSARPETTGARSRTQNAKILTPRVRQDFSRLIRTIGDLIKPPIGFPGESNAEMQRKQKEYEANKKYILGKFANQIKAIRNMVSQYPELRKYYSRELEALKI